VCSSLTSLPQRLHVAGDLNFALCTSLAMLPNGLSVTGKLDMSHCSELAALPDKLSVGRTLNLAKCTGLTSLPDELHVAGDLNLSGCKNLTRLPNTLTVAGKLDLSHCSKITALPVTLRVGKALDLTACKRLTWIPDGLQIGRDLNLSQCTNLTVLPNRLNVAGDLNVSDCTSLICLPDRLCIGGSVDFTMCKKLTVLPRRFTFTGDLNLSFCSDLAELPEGLQVEGNLNLTSCSSLTILPSELSVGGALILARCTGLSTLPDDLSSGGNLDCSNCTRLTALNSARVASTWLTGLPSGPRVIRDIDLQGCTSLAELPEELCEVRNLNLTGCSMLTALPEGLRVTGNLHLEKCTGLALLPEALSVAGMLNLSGCTSLATLPTGLSVGEDLFLENCSLLESLPSAILSWQQVTSRSYDSCHNIYIGGSGLSQDTLDWLQVAEAPFVRFHVDLRDGIVDDYEEAVSEVPFESISEALAFWKHESGEHVPSTSFTLSRDGTHTVLEFLSKLRGAKEFGILETRRALAQRVMNALKLLHFPECRAEVIQRMEDSLDACNDKPIWALNQLTLVGLISSARGNRCELRALGRRVMNLQIVHEHVEKKISTLHWVDDVCVYLRFEIELREALNLPVDATAMIFSNYIQVSGEELQAVEQEVSEITEEAFEAWLHSWTEWQRQERLETAECICWEQLEIDPCVCPSRVPDSDLSGDILCDPVVLRDQVWSLRDLLRHWIPTGLDLTNAVLRGEDLTRKVRRVGVPQRRSLRKSIRRSLRVFLHGKK